MHDLRDGIRALFGAPAVRTYALVNMAIDFGFSGIIALLVVYVRDVLGGPGGQYGLILSVAGLGTVVTSLVVASRDERHPRTPWAVASVAGVASFAFTWFQPSFVFLIPIAFAAGLADAGLGIPAAATLAEALPNEIRGRANSMSHAMLAVAETVGSIGFAWLGEPGRLGPAHAIALAAVVGTGLAAVVIAGGGFSAIARHDQVRLAGLRPDRS